jgi:SAM-dependent methyltransferase
MPLHDHEDAFGHALMDQLEGVDDTAEIIERDDGFIALSARSVQYLSGPATWGESDLAAVREMRGRVLDVGCGAGRFALHLQQEGHDVVAIDTSPLAVEVCRRRGVVDARILSIRQISRSLGSFDTIIMMGNNIALFGSADRMQRILRRMDRVTNPGGRIVAEGIDPYETDDPAHLAYHARNLERGRMGGQIRMRVRYRTYRTPWFDYMFLSVDELEAQLSRSAWRLANVIDGAGPGYVAVLEKRG